MEQLYSLIIDATNHILRSMHVVYSLLALVSFVYMTQAVADVIERASFWRFEEAASRVGIVIRAVAVGGGFLLLMYLFFG